MKKQMAFALTVLFATFQSIAQQKISLDATGNAISVQDEKGNSTSVENLNTADDIILKFNPALTGLIYELKSTDGTKDYSDQIQGIIINGISLQPVPLTLTIKKGNGSVLHTISDIGRDYRKEAANGESNEEITSLTNTTAYDYFYNKFSDFQNYNRKEDEAYFWLDENGVLLTTAPVNVDADDYIIVHLVVPKKDLSQYSIEVIGDYNPTDLLIRPYDPIANTEELIKKRVEYTHITRKFGPFTSDQATIKIFKNGQELKNSVSVRINKLYHVAIGASFISTDLAKPSFDVFPLTDTTNTINSINNGNRTLATFNVIFYWKPTIDWITDKLKGKSHITRGRDILKEATLWERLNPIFGVALNNKWDENFFFGGIFEFARGGSITVGGHYGKVQKLANKNFVLGQSVYTDTKENIKLTDKWEWGFFMGITLDTRIFNKVLLRK